MYQQQQQQSVQNNLRTHIQSTFPQPMETRTMGRQEMKGPSIDHNLFNGTPLATNHPNTVPMKPIPMPNNNVQQQQQRPPGYYDDINEDDRFSIASSDSSLTTINSDVKSVTVRKAVVSNKNSKKGNKSGGFELNIS